MEKEELELIRNLLPFLIPLIILELGLLVFALVDLIRRKRVTGNNKIVWILVIVLINLIGPIIYLAVGRKEAPIDSDQD
jgi:hypothetical protein